MAWTFVPVPGQPDPLRACLISSIWLPAQDREELGNPDPEYRALVSGAPVTLTGERLAALAPGHPALPDDLGAYPAYRLYDGNTLVGIPPGDE